MATITDQRALAPFRKPAGVSFQVIERKTDWGHIAGLGLKFLGGCSLLWLVSAVLWRAGS